MTAEPADLRDRFSGLLLGAAIGDALGLPFEGWSAKGIARRAPDLDRFSFLGRRGFVSDDTEQSALLARSLVFSPRDLDRARRSFRASLLGWFLRLPWGIGLGTLAACVKIAFGFERSGSRSAGNGAAMRAAIVGAFFCDDAPARRRWSEALAEVTHVDRRAVEGAGFVAELAASCTRAGVGDDRDRLVGAAAAALEEGSLRGAISTARRLAGAGTELEEAARELGSSGYVVHSLGIAVFCFITLGGDRQGRPGTRRAPRRAHARC